MTKHQTANTNFETLMTNFCNCLLYTSDAADD